MRLSDFDKRSSLFKVDLIGRIVRLSPLDPSHSCKYFTIINDPTYFAFGYGPIITEEVDRVSYFKGGNISKYLIKFELHDADKHFRIFLQVLLRVYRNGIIYGDLLKGSTQGLGPW